MDDVPGPSTAPYFNLSKNTENFARLCQLIMTICSDLFRDILSRHINLADLRSKLDCNRDTLKKILNAQQKKQIYPSSGTTALDFKDLDISVMYILLRNICNIAEHKNGWGKPPQDADTSLAACIERIRTQRNLITGHSSNGEMTDTEFQDHWDKLKNSILEIEKHFIGGDKYERGVNKLWSCDLNPSRAEEYVKEFKTIEVRLDNIEREHLSTSTHITDRLDSIEQQRLSTNKYITDRLSKFEELLSSIKNMTGNRYVDTSHIPFHLKNGDDNEERILNDLHVACRKAEEERSRIIIQRNHNLLHTVDDNGWNAALHASLGGNITILQLLANNKVDIKHKSNNGQNILHVACLHSNLEMSRHIIQTYPDLLHSVDNDGWNAALHAVRGGNIEILQLLADRKLAVKHENSGLNILLMACGTSNLQMSRCIIQSYPELLHSTDKGGQNAALYAAGGGNVTILQLLIDNGVDFKYKANNGWDILRVACASSNLEMSRYIIQSWPDLLHSVDNDGRNAALYAAVGGNVKILQLLVDNKVEVTEKDNNGRNILHLACRYSNLEMSRYIIQTYPHLLHGVDNDGWNAALYAARRGNIAILQLLANNKVDVKHKNKHGTNILHLACLYSNLEMSHYIIRIYPDLLHSVDNKGCNSALYAARGGSVELLQLLANNDIDVNLKAKTGWNILHGACGTSNLKMSRYIIETYPNLLHGVDNDGWNAALHAARGGNIAILQLLANYEVDVKHKSKDGTNILHVACLDSNLEMSHYIIRNTPDLLHSVDNKGCNSALYAARGGSVKLLQLLVDNEVDLKHKTKHGWNILHLACLDSNLEMSRYIIQTYPDLLHSVDNDGWNAALHAARGGSAKILQLLVDNEVDVKYKNKDGWNILHVACFYANLEMSRYIIQTYPDLLHSVDNGGWNAALHAARGGNIAILQLLANYEVDVKHKIRTGWTILHVACRYSNLNMSHYIIQTYPDLLHSVDNNGWNAALHAARGGNINVLQLLAKNAVDVKHKNNKGCNIFNVACYYSNLEMFRHIIQTYPDLLHNVDNKGWNIELHAVQKGDVEILRLLAANGVNIKYTIFNGEEISTAVRLQPNPYPGLVHSEDTDKQNVCCFCCCPWRKVGTSTNPYYL